MGIREEKVKAGVELRKRIKQLAYGTFDYREPEFSLSTERIELEVIEGKDVTGEFTIHGGERKLRGIVYSTHPRMECLTPQFDGEEIRIRYQFHSEGLVEGDIRKGEFVIVCDQGEYNLSFVVSVSKRYAMTSVGKMKNLGDFVRLARENFAESYQVFYSVNFPNLLKEDEIKERLLYEAIRKETPSMQAVEAFLVGIGKKKPVEVVLEQESICLSNISVSEKEQLCLRKEDWGYVCGEVSTDANFIRLEKTSITSEEFLGSTCFFEYYIDAEALHAGKNYGRILFEFPGQKLACEFCVTKASADAEADEIEQGASAHKKELQGRTRLIQLYIDYRLKKIVTGVWAKESIQTLEELLDIDSANDLYRLMKAQAFLVNRQRQEASWILEDYKRSAERKDTPEWGYYLYLCTLMEREESYVNRLAEQIEELFHLYPDNSMLFWILLFVREDYYVNNDRRLKAVERWIEAGNDSPYFYLEAYYLYWQDPYLLTKLGGFELKILNWARKQNAISKEIAMQILHLVSGEVHFSEKVFALLLDCYELVDTEEAVIAICSYLIKGQKFSKEYHKWYALGIEYEARITNLYEAYLLSADEESLAPVPKVVFMYFQYHNALSYKQLALLYAYIIKTKDKLKDIYVKYRRTIERFAMSQIEAGHIDENLAVIYQEMLPLGILNQELAEKLVNVLFVHKLTIVDSTKRKQFVRAIIVQKQWKQISYVQLTDGVAYFSAYTKDYCILLQDAKGQLFADSSFYEECALLDVDLYLKMARKFAPNVVPYLVHSFSENLENESFSAKDEAGMAIVLASQNVKEEWKAAVLPAFVRHFASKEFGSQVEGFLQNANYKLMTAEDRRFMVEQLIENHFFEQAYEMLHLYGYDSIGSAYRVTICSYEITAGNFEEDEFLLGLAEDTFNSGKYNDVILIYLCKYFNGAIRQMTKIWSAAGQFDIDTYDLEERIITQMLYSTDYMEQIAEIYESYCQGGGRELICMAYLSYFSHLYLVKEAVVHSHVFEQNEHRILLHQEVNDVQKFALLKYYANLEQLSDSQYKMADALLQECTGRNLNFGFYKQLDGRLKAKYQLYDKFYVEHHMKPGLYAKINYRINDEAYREEELKEVYDGIYVKEFVLFFGDELAYYITETDRKKGQSTTISGQIENRDVYADEGENRYTMLNSMLFNVTLQETDTLKKDMMDYHKKKISTEAVFKLL